MNGKKVVVIGSGVAGLACAARLTKLGWDVEVLESKDDIGGRCGSFFDDAGFRFDVGASMIFLESEMCKMNRLVGATFPRTIRCEPSVQAIFSDNTIFTLKENAHEIPALFLASARTFFEAASTHMVLACSPSAWEAALAAPVQWIKVLLSGGLNGLYSKTRNQVLYQFPGMDPVRINKICMGLTFQTMYLGMGPFRSPAVYSLLVHDEIQGGISYPIEGGMRAIPAALTKVLKRPVRTGLHVLKVDSDVDSRPIVHTENCSFRADAVVFAGDTLHGTDHIAGLSLGRFDAARSLVSTISSVNFYWGCDKTFADKLLGAHSVFLPPEDQYEASFDSLHRGEFPEFPSFYLHVPSRSDPGGCLPVEHSSGECLVALVPVPNLNDANPMLDREELIRRCRAQVLSRLLAFGVDLEPHVVSETVKTPYEWRDNHLLHAGSILGLAHNLFQMLMLRPSRHARQAQVYFTGASTFPGTGVPLVMSGGIGCANLVHRDAHSRCGAFLQNSLIAVGVITAVLVTALAY
jgi:phytoene desaturase (3,4-didehydrolycopene-forming)